MVLNLILVDSYKQMGFVLSIWFTGNGHGISKVVQFPGDFERKTTCDLKAKT